MIEKKRWLLITFHTTSEAMSMDVAGYYELEL